MQKKDLETFYLGAARAFLSNGDVSPESLAKLLLRADSEGNAGAENEALRKQLALDAGNVERFTSTELLAAIDRAGFKVSMSVGHPLLLFPTKDDQVTLWCKACERDSGFHWRDCPEADKKFKRE